MHQFRFVKRIISLLFVVFLSLLCCTEARADASGACGDAVRWNLNSNGVLTISGTWSMYDYSFSSHAPWYQGRNQITSVIVEEGVTNIGNYAFDGCSNLTSVTIPSSMTSIGYSAFSNTKLNTVNISDIASWCNISYDYQYQYSDNSYYNNSCPLGKYNLYLNGEPVADLVIPSNVTSISTKAFCGCSGLISVTIPESVTSIGYGAFGSCSGLTSTSILPITLNLGNHAFSECSSLSDIYYNGTAAQWNQNVNAGLNPKLPDVNIHTNDSGSPVIISKGKSLNLAWCLDSSRQMTITGSGAMDDYVATVPAPWAPLRSCIESVVIESGVTSIGREAFSGCSNLANVIIPSSVKSIGASAFSGCRGLSSIEIPSSVTSIQENVFSECSGLMIVGIPASVTNISGSAFSGCSSLAEIQVDANNTRYHDVEGVLFDANINTLIIYPCGRYGDYSIPTKVTSIGRSAFSGCKNLTSVEIPSSVTSIGPYAFSGCSILTYVNIPSGVTNIEEGTFSGCDGIVSMIIPSNVNSIGMLAFSNCKGLSDLTMLDGVSNIVNGAFSGCGNLTNVTIPLSMRSINYRAFGDCNNLTNVYYAGTRTQWNNIAFGVNYNGETGNDSLLNASMHYNYSVPSTFSVNYDANGGTGAPEAQEKTESVTLTLSSMQPTRESIENGSITVRLNFNDGNNTQFSLTTTKWITYAFIEWNTLANGSGVSYASGADYTANEAVTLFVQWETSIIGDPVTLLTPSRDGYIFRGWATSRDAKDGITGNYVPTNNVTLYAVWVAPDLVLPTELTIIDKESFSGGAFTFVKLSEKTATIGWHAFADCPNLAYIYIPSATTEIDPNAFYNVTNLTILGTPGSVAESYANAHNYTFASFQ